MKEECDLLTKCGFFAKYGDMKELACKGFILKYCRGPKMEICKRKEYRLKQGFPPPDNMLPTGGMMKEDDPTKCIR